jgi:hypothetical protein
VSHILEEIQYIKLDDVLLDVLLLLVLQLYLLLPSCRVLPSPLLFDLVELSLCKIQHFFVLEHCFLNEVMQDYEGLYAQCITGGLEVLSHR